MTDIASLHTYLETNRFAALKLADAYYPLAQLIGWGYLDLSTTPGETYTYRVEALVGGGSSRVVGEVSLVAGQRTPIPAPTNLTAVELQSAGLLESQSGDWTAAQKNRRFDRRVYLKWLPVHLKATAIRSTGRAGAAAGGTTRGASPAARMGRSASRATPTGISPTMWLWRVRSNCRVRSI